VQRGPILIITPKKGALLLMKSPLLKIENIGSNAKHSLLRVGAGLASLKRPANVLTQALDELLWDMSTHVSQQGTRSGLRRFNIRIRWRSYNVRITRRLVNN
jgi:hypothetical protein